MRYVWTTQYNSRIFQHTCPWWVSSPRSYTLQFPSIAIDLRGTCKKEFTCHCHLSLKSAKLKCVSNVTIYNLPFAGMISNLGSTGWTSTLIHKTGKRERVDRSENATKRDDLQCCTLDGSLHTTRPHVKNEVFSQLILLVSALQFELT
jgi:hypothetical protein